MPGVSTNYEFNRILAWLEGTVLPTGHPDRPDMDDETQNNELQLTLLPNDKNIYLNDTIDKSDSSRYQSHYKSAATTTDDEEDDELSKLHPESTNSLQEAFIRDTPQIDSLGGLSLLP